MIIKEYMVERIATPAQEPIDQWKIQLSLEPCWFEQHFMGRIFPERRTLIGSCSSWHWGDGKPADYFWRLWAHAAVRKAIKTKTGGATYVNSRFNRSEDE